MNDDIQLISVHGLNLTVPEDAKAIIKSWDEREDTSKYADSNVDDQVIVPALLRGQVYNDDTLADGHLHTILRERTHQITSAQVGFVASLFLLFDLLGAYFIMLTAMSSRPR
jgi:PITH domain